MVTLEDYGLSCGTGIVRSGYPSWSGVLLLRGARADGPLRMGADGFSTSYGETHQPWDLWERYGNMIEI